MAHLTKCKACGCAEFSVDEDYVWTASLDKYSQLFCTKPEAEITCISCRRCWAKYGEHEFGSVHFN